MNNNSYSSSINIFDFINYNNISNNNSNSVEIYNNIKLDEDLSREDLEFDNVFDIELDEYLSGEDLDTDNELDEDINKDLDISWINKYDNIEKNYGIFYNVKPKYVNAFILYIDLSLNLIFIDKHKFNFNDCIFKENIICFLNKKKK